MLHLHSGCAVLLPIVFSDFHFFEKVTLTPLNTFVYNNPFGAGAQDRSQLYGVEPVHYFERGDQRIKN